MKVSDLLAELEEGDRTIEHLKMIQRPIPIEQGLDPNVINQMLGAQHSFGQLDALQQAQNIGGYLSQPINLSSGWNAVSNRNIW